MNKNINSQVEITAFKEYAETVWVYLKNSNSKGTSYDPNRNTGYTETIQNPLAVKAIVHPLSGNSLVARELGLSQMGSIELIIQKKDMNLFKICQKIKYDGNEYSTFNKALGNTVQITKRSFDFYRVLLFILRGN
jgi:hypothetical protein